MKLDINTDLIEGEHTQDAFDKLKDVWAKEAILHGSFKMIEIAFTKSGTFTVAHGLGFKPIDIIQTRLTGAGSLTWNYATFDSTNLSITVTGACAVRAFIGAYRDV